jgi:hypothetical protein
MKSPNIAKQLECHGFVCQSPEDAIVIAATLYQSLMAYMSGSQVIFSKIYYPRTKEIKNVHLQIESTNQKAKKSERNRLYEHREQFSGHKCNDFIEIFFPR